MGWFEDTGSVCYSNTPVFTMHDLPPPPPETVLGSYLGALKGWDIAVIPFLSQMHLEATPSVGGYMRS